VKYDGYFESIDFMKGDDLVINSKNN